MTEPKLFAVDHYEPGEYFSPVGGNSLPVDVEWYCEPPGMKVPFQAIREEWNENFTVRKIYEIAAEES
jgi:hypothetical protein